MSIQNILGFCKQIFDFVCANQKTSVAIVAGVIGLLSLPFTGRQPQPILASRVQSQKPEQDLHDRSLTSTPSQMGNPTANAEYLDCSSYLQVAVTSKNTVAEVDSDQLSETSQALAQQKKNSLVKRVVSLMGCYLAGKLIYALVDQGIANTLALETLRHGTNPISYIFIRIMGGLPNLCVTNCNWGSTFGLAADASRYFFVFKDSEFPWYKAPLLLQPIIKSILPYGHKFLSAYNLVFHRMKMKIPFIARIAGIVNCFITPVLKFRFAEIDPKIFINDPDYGGAAYKTNEVIAAWRIGILGSLITGINFQWLDRVCTKPEKFITGIVQLAVGGSLIAYLKTKNENWNSIKSSLIFRLCLG